MLLHLDDTRMLELWRQGAGLEPAFDNASVERFDALNVNEVLRRAMRVWYTRYLTEEPTDMVPVSDLTPYLVLTAGPAPDQWTVGVSCDVTRITGVGVRGYGMLPIIDPRREEHSDVVYRLCNKFVRNGGQPAAYYVNDSKSLILNIKSEESPKIDILRGVRVTDDELFIVDERVLDRIPELAREALYGSK